MDAPRIALFETAIGACAIAWGAQGVVSVLLPDADPAATRRRLLRRFTAGVETAPTPEMQAVIDSIVALLRGEPRDLGAVPLDMTRVPAFHQRVYAVARTIPAGSTLTYGEVAAQLGDRALARDVGHALGRNPFPIVVPCHRVMAAGNKAGGFSAPGGVTTKLRMLRIEGAGAAGPRGLFDEG